MAVVRPLLDHRSELAEGPVWDASDGSLLWVDIPAGEVHRHVLGTDEVATISLGVAVGAVCLRAAGGLVAATARGFSFLDRDGELEREIPVEADLPGNRMNDGKADPQGRFWAGTMALDESPGAGALYRLDPDGSVERILTGVGLSNGLDWSADGATLYFVDSLTGRVDAFDFDAGAGRLGNRRPLVEVEGGTPDGLTLDADGFLWVALWGGGCVRRYSPEGDAAEEVALPTPGVTSCAFGGTALDTLFVTTDGRRGDGAGGRLFAAEPGPVGRPPNRFAG
jgi:sugar lactone lactonase YvrE